MSNPGDQALEDAMRQAGKLEDVENEIAFEREVFNLMRPALEKIAARFGQDQWLHLALDFKYNTGTEESISVAGLSLTAPISNGEA